MLSPPPTRFALGLDLGKLSDYTALAVVEEHAVERDPEWWSPKIPEPGFVDDPVRVATWLQRWPLRTEYHRIARDVAAMIADLAARPRAEVRLFYDATGVGVSVGEVLDREPAIARVGAVPVTITAGSAITRDGDGFHVAKGPLIFQLHTAMQRERLKVVPSLPEAATVRRELEGFEMKVSAAAHMTFQHREGQHDDLLLALAVALFGAGQRPPVATVYNYRRQRWE